MDFLLLPLAFLLLSTPLLSTADEYFISCGSSSPSPSPTNDARTFSPDTSHPGVHLLSSRTPTVSNNPHQTHSPLYRTSLVFSSPSAYRLNILTPGTYLLRLHFLSSSPPSRFNVSASGGLPLLTDFTPTPNSLVLHEFLLFVNSGEFRLFFVPCSPSLTAFVTAIELFLTPLTPLSGSPPVAVSPGVADINLISTVLHPIHRITFGGQTVPSSNDRLWRTWLPDDPFLQSKSAARNGPIRISRPNYRGGNATDYDAPDAVYNTAKELNRSSRSGHLDPFFNATWSFGVSKGSRYFVRVHFCDMISAALGATVFDLYISPRFAWKVDPYMVAPYLAAPFYLDFVVESDDTGFMNVSVGPRNDTRITENAFINGLEIMEILLSSSAVEPEICEGGLSKIGLAAMIGLVSCLVAVGYLLATYLKPYKEVIKVKTAELFPHWQFVKLEGGVNSESELGEKTTSKLLGC